MAIHKRLQVHVIKYIFQGDQFDDGFDSDLMGDEEDRAQLEDMTEAQREKILYERTERREAMKKRWEIEKVKWGALS